MPFRVPDTGLPRRGFLAAGAGAFLCTIGGQRVLLRNAGDAAKADAAARRVKRPQARAAADIPGAGPTEKLTFTTPRPQPGGVAREYWIQASDFLWDIVPTRPRRDQWHGRSVQGPSVYRAFIYQQMTEGFAQPLLPPRIPGPTPHAEVGDTVVVHFRNGLSEDSGQALTMHPHGVKYNPEYDGVYLGDFTRAGGFIEPGSEFTYTWEATPDSVGVWP
jgi:Multicopper oxidase